MNRRTFMKLMGLASVAAAIPIPLSATASDACDPSAAVPAAEGDFEVPSGWCRLSSYMNDPAHQIMVQWGRTLGGTITFPAIFYKPLSVFAMLEDQTPVSVAPGSITNTGARVDALDAYWVAIGEA